MRLQKQGGIANKRTVPRVPVMGTQPNRVNLDLVVPANRPKLTLTAMIGENLEREKPLLTKTKL